MKNLTIYQALTILTCVLVTYNITFVGINKDVIIQTLLVILLTCINFTIPDTYIKTKLKNLF